MQGRWAMHETLSVMCTVAAVLRNVFCPVDLSSDR